MDSGGFDGGGGYGGSGFMASQGMSPSTQMQEGKQVNGTEGGACVCVCCNAAIGLVRK